jgi:hypothetical protein
MNLMKAPREERQFGVFMLGLSDPAQGWWAEAAIS